MCSLVGFFNAQCQARRPVLLGLPPSSSLLSVRACPPPPPPWVVFDSRFIACFSQGTNYWCPSWLSLLRLSPSLSVLYPLVSPFLSWAAVSFLAAAAEGRPLSSYQNCCVTLLSPFALSPPFTTSPAPGLGRPVTGGPLTAPPVSRPPPSAGSVEIYFAATPPAPWPA